MSKYIKSLWMYLNLIRSIPAILCMYSCKSSGIIKKDVERWLKEKKYDSNKPLWWNFHVLMLNFPEFRNLFYHRVKKNNFIAGHVLKVFYPPLGTLYIATQEIGEGLYILHGFSTIIAAKSIGKNCTIFQQVTVGYSHINSPILNDNVLITCGAKVIGGVNVGSNVKIGANSVVVKDVPENCTVIGIPARIIKKNREKVDIAL